jgi:hypothetical protein
MEKSQKPFTATYVDQRNGSSNGSSDTKLVSPNGIQMNPKPLKVVPEGCQKLTGTES